MFCVLDEANTTKELPRRSKSDEEWFSVPIDDRFWISVLRFTGFPSQRQRLMPTKEKYKKVENRGIDPRASRMQIERSTIWANPPIDDTAKYMN